MTDTETAAFGMRVYHLEFQREVTVGGAPGDSAGMLRADLDWIERL